MAYYNDSPRVSAGRRNPLVAPIPYANVRQSIGPQGETTSFNARNLPITQPGLDDDLPSERRMRLQNEGIVPRGPSSPQMGMNAAPAPQQMTPQPMQGFAGGGGAAPAPAPARPVIYNKTQHALLTSLYKRASDAAVQQEKLHAGTPEHQKALEDQATARKALDDYERSNLSPAPATQPSAAAATPAQPVNSPAMPFTNPQTGAPQMNAPITDKNRIDVNAPGYQDRRREALDTAYATAGASLQANPNLGMAPPPKFAPAPLTVPPGGMGNSPADYRQASAQAYRNQAVIQRQHNAMDAQNVAQNQAQQQMNDNARVAVSRYQGERMAQNRAADPPVNYAQPAPTTQPAQVATTQPAPTSQPAQAAGDFQEGQILHSPSNPGKFWKVVNGVPQPM